jgi:hypothetical protein
VGWIAADAALHAAVDPAQPDLRVVPLQDAATGPLDVVVVTGATLDAVAALLPAWSAHTAATCWIAAGRAGGSPPCPRCAAAALGDAADVPRELAALRAAVLGTVVATEVVKTVLAIGGPLAGRAIAYDPATATISSLDVAARHDCVCRGEISCS